MCNGTPFTDDKISPRVRIELGPLARFRIFDKLITTIFTIIPNIRDPVEKVVQE